MFKIFFNLSIFSAMIFWSMGIGVFTPNAAEAADCPVLAAGDLFKVPGNSAVYLLNANLERLYFPHASIYKTWYDDYSKVKEIPTVCVDSYPAPSKAPFGVNYRPGSKLVKVQISPSVYAVEPGNKISKIGSETAAKSLYGNNWASEVVDVADVFWPNYVSRGSDLTGATPHDGMLIKTSDSNIIYQVKNGQRYEVKGNVRGDVKILTKEILEAVNDAGNSVIAENIYKDPTQEAIETVVEETPVTAEITETLPTNIRITSANGGSVKPSIVWGETGYGVVWSDVRNGGKGEIYFTFLDEKGNKLTTDMQITDTPTLISTNPEIIWNGSEFGVVYTEYDDILSVNSTVNFLRVNKNGVKLGGVTEVTNNVSIANPSIAWDGSGYGIVWRTPNNSNAKTYFSYLSSVGVILREQIRVLTDEASDQTEIVWDGKKFGIVYRQGVKKLGLGDNADYTVGAYFYRVDKNGDAERAKSFVTGKEAVAAIWDGNSYVIAENNKTFSRFDINSNLLVTNKVFSTDGLNNMDIANDGTQYGIVGERGGLVYFVEIDNVGAVKQIEMSISATVNAVSTLPRISWSGNKYGVVWSDTKDNNNGGEIYFRAVNKL